MEWILNANLKIPVNAHELPHKMLIGNGSYFSWDFDNEFDIGEANVSGLGSNGILLRCLGLIRIHGKKLINCKFAWVTTWGM